jgi:hypothetical protein
MVNIVKIAADKKIRHGSALADLRHASCVTWETCMIFRNWGACALSVLVAFSLGGIAHNAEAARSAASSQQIKKKNVRVAAKATSKKRVVAA